MHASTVRPASQIQAIKQHLLAGHSLTASEALTNFGSFRLAAAIKRLRDSGMNIVTTEKQNPATGVRYASYSMGYTPAPGDRVQVVSTSHSAKAVLCYADEYYAVGDKGTVKFLEADGSVEVQFDKLPGTKDYRCDDGRWWISRKDIVKVGK